MKYEFKDSGELKTLSEEELLAADDDSFIIVKNTGVQDDSKPYWAYVAVRPSKYREFMEFTKEHKTVKLADYGQVIHYGIGNEIPEDIKQQMKLLYGCDDAYMEKLTKDVNDARVTFFKERENERIVNIVEMLKNKSMH